MLRGNKRKGVALCAGFGENVQCHTGAQGPCVRDSVRMCNGAQDRSEFLRQLQFRSRSSFRFHFRFIFVASLLQCRHVFAILVCFAVFTLFCGLLFANNRETRDFAGCPHRVSSDFRGFHDFAGFSLRVLSDFRGIHDFAGFSHRVLSDFEELHDFAGFSHRVIVRFSGMPRFRGFSHRDIIRFSRVS